MTTPSLFEGETPVTALIELQEDSGPVSPDYQFERHLVLRAGKDGVALRVDEDRAWSEGKPTVSTHEERRLARADYEALWADLLRHDVFAHGGDITGDRSRIGVSFNTLEVRLGDRHMRLDYTLAQLSRTSNAARRALIERVRALAQAAPD